MPLFDYNHTLNHTNIRNFSNKIKIKLGIKAFKYSRISGEEEPLFFKTNKKTENKDIQYSQYTSP